MCRLRPGPFEPPPVTVLKVVYDADSSTADWYFDANIFEVPDVPTGLLVDGNEIDAVDSADANVLTAEYPGPFTPGTPWAIVPPTTNIEFVGGGQLKGQTGVVVAS